MIKMIEERGKKGQKTKVIGLSNYMTWAHSKSKIGNF